MRRLQRFSLGRGSDHSGKRLFSKAVMPPPNMQEDHHMTSSTVDPREIEKFSRLARQWWDAEHGPMYMLHRMNPVRVNFIRKHAELYARTLQMNGTRFEGSSGPTEVEPLRGLRVLDVGCGGGILAESLARLGASVTGIDAAQESIRIAQLHKQSLHLQHGSLQYHAKTAEALLQEDGFAQSFDLVCSMEVIEHVSDPQQLLSSCRQLLKPGGLFFASTVNRTTLSYALGIVVAENILGMVPRGTHDHGKFVTPEEFSEWLSACHFDRQGITFAGLFYNPVTRAWIETDPRTNPLALQVNYMLAAQAPHEETAQE